MKEIVVDATGGIMGRVASFAAKQALLGNTVDVINCNDVLITGNKTTILEKYRKMRARGGSSQKGPNFPRGPEKIMKRTVRGMLSYRQGRGSAALKRVKCYNKMPSEFESKEKVSLIRDLSVRGIKLNQISKEM